MGGTTSGAQAASQMDTAASGGGWDAAANPPPSGPQSAEPSNASQPSSQTPAANASSPTMIDSQEAPVYTPQPVVVTSQKPPGIFGVVDSIANALVGKTVPEIGTDADGNKYVKQQTMSRGQQWVRIGADLVGGAAKGMAAGKGRNPGAAAAAGFDQGQQQSQQQQQQQQDMSAEARQQNLDGANKQMLQMKIADNSWNMARNKTKASQEDTKFYQDQIDSLVKEGGQVLGTASHPGDIDGILKTDPEVMKNLVQKGIIRIMPHNNPDGTPGGIVAIKMPDGHGNEMLPPGALGHSYNPITGKIDEFKYSDGLTRGEQINNDQAAVAAQQKALNDKTAMDYKQAQTDQAKANAGRANAEATKVPSEIAENKARTAQSYSEAEKNRAQSKQLNEASDQQVIQSNAQQLVEGDADPSNLSKRSKSYDATLSAANAYSQQKYGKSFNVAKAIGDYKFATNTQTYNTLNYLNSLTGRDDKSGNLGKLVQMSDAMPRATTFPPLNEAAQWAKISSGNSQISNYYAAVTEVSDQVAKILQGGNGGGTSDAKLRQAQDLFNKGFTAAQIRGVANDTLRPLLANRKTEIIGDNRYLQQWHQPVQQGAGSGGSGSNGGNAKTPIAPPAGAPAGASQVWHDAQGKILGYTVNGSYQAVH